MEDFDRFAQNYEQVLDQTLTLSGETGEYFAEYKAVYIARDLGKDFAGRILDYGCGIGLLSRFLVKHLPAATVDGFDVSTASIDHVPADLKKKGVFKADMGQLRSGYDVIVLANVMHHVEPAQRQAVIHSLKPLLASGGKIMIFEHNPANPLTVKTVKDSPLDKGVVLLPPSETAAYFKTAGLERTRSEYIVFFPKFLSALRCSEPYLSWLPLGAQYVVTGQVQKESK